MKRFLIPGVLLSVSVLGLALWGFACPQQSTGAPINDDLAKSIVGGCASGKYSVGSVACDGSQNCNDQVISCSTQKSNQRLSLVSDDNGKYQNPDQGTPFNCYVCSGGITNCGDAKVYGFGTAPSCE